MSIISSIGEAAALHGWVLRSGGAHGMDSLFEAGWGVQKEIYIPWPGFNGRTHGVDGAIDVTDPTILRNAAVVARQIHPSWNSLKPGGKALHTRNVFQVLGEFMHTPSDICIYYAPIDYTGSVKGGTRTAVQLCKTRGIPTYNLMMTDDIIDLGIKLELQWNNDSFISTM